MNNSESFEIFYENCYNPVTIQRCPRPLDAPIGCPYKKQRGNKELTIFILHFAHLIVPLQSKRDACMKRYLIRLSLVAALLCGSLLGFTVKAQGAVTSRQQDAQQIKQDNRWIHHVAEEPERAPFSLLRPTSSHRVTSIREHRSSARSLSRPVRLLPTHGGKPGQGRWANGQSSYHPKFSLQLPCISLQRLYTPAASPRRYYVIALRRLLC